MCEQFVRIRCTYKLCVSTRWPLDKPIECAGRYESVRVTNESKMVASSIASFVRNAEWYTKTEKTPPQNRQALNRISFFCSPPPLWNGLKNARCVGIWRTNVVSGSTGSKDISCDHHRASTARLRCLYRAELTRFFPGRIVWMCDCQSRLTHVPISLVQCECVWSSAMSADRQARGHSGTHANSFPNFTRSVHAPAALSIGTVAKLRVPTSLNRKQLSLSRGHVLFNAEAPWKCSS